MSVAERRAEGPSRLESPSKIKEYLFKFPSPSADE